MLLPEKKVLSRMVQSGFCECLNSRNRRKGWPRLFVVSSSLATRTLTLFPAETQFHPHGGPICSPVPPGSLNSTMARELWKARQHKGSDGPTASTPPLSCATLPRKTRGQVRKPVVLCPVRGGSAAAGPTSSGSRNLAMEGEAATQGSVS